MTTAGTLAAALSLAARSAAWAGPGPQAPPPPQAVVGAESAPTPVVAPSLDEGPATAVPPAPVGAPPQGATPAENDGDDSEPAADDSEPAADDSEPVELEDVDARATDEPATTDTYDPLRDGPEALQATRHIRGGAILLGAGVLLGIGAAVLGTRDPCMRSAGNSCNEDARRRAALTMGIPGLVITAAGVGLLTAGLVSARKIRGGIAVAHHGGGLWVGGAF